MHVAVVGTGYWGANLARNLAELRALGCVCDANPDRAANIGEKYRVRATASYSDVLRDRNLTAIVIATPAETHYDLARQALLEGKDVFVEKPITLRCAECADLIELAERCQRILMVGHQLKYHPAILKLKELIDTGRLGTLEYIYSNRLNLGKVRREENALWSFAPHDISVLLFLLNDAMPLEVCALGGTYLQPNVSDITVSHLLFDRGVRAHIFVSWLHPYKEQKLIVIGQTAMACFDDVSKDSKLQVFSKDIRMENGSFVAQRPVGTTVPCEESEPLRNECRHFLHCLERRVLPRTDGRDGYRVLSVLQACQRSLQLNGEPVQLNARALEAIHAA